jgi:hypothetical protein
MANIKIAAIADTTQISKSVQSFIDRNPEFKMVPLLLR